MLVLSFSVGRLECSFHLSILFIIIRILIRAAKIELFFNKQRVAQFFTQEPLISDQSKLTSSANEESDAAHLLTE